MDLDAYFAKMNYKAYDENFKSGFVALVGRPNSGKSTLLNTIMGKKIAITSQTAQTTRHRLRAILTTDESQIVFVDTPGIHKPHDALGEELNASALKALEDIDVVCFLVDLSSPVGTGDMWVAKQVQACDAKKVCVLSKRDKVDEQTTMKQFEAILGLGTWDSVVVLSSFEKYNIDAFLEEITAFLPKGPAWFPSDMETDQPLEVIIAEYIREKILYEYSDEIPHAIGVQVTELSYDEERDLQSIYACIYVEHESQKGIVIGKGGKALKRVGTSARKDLERLMGGKVYLDLRVKSKKNWRRDANQIRRFGYGEGL